MLTRAQLVVPLLLVLASPRAAHGLNNGLAIKPPMGYNTCAPP